MIFRCAFALALLCLAAVAPAATAWDPARTWVFAVSIAEFAGDRLHDFDPGGRIDGEFEALFLSRGVPRDHVVVLKDAQATTAAIRRQFDQLLGRSGAGDLLVFYFGSHGSYDPKAGAYSFSTYEGSVAYDWAVEAIERSFRGDRALLTTDTCYSGGMLEVVRKQARPRVSYACLSSMDAHSSGSNVWRFMRWLMRGFSGDPRADLDGDGQVRLDELARATRHELAYLRGTSPLFLTTGQFDPRMALAPAGAPVPGAGRLVVVGGARAAVEREEGGRVQVRRGADDRVVWVPRERVADAPAPARHAAGERVWIESTCCPSEVWRPATVLDAWEGLAQCRPEGFDARYDEWVDDQRLLPSVSGAWSGHYENSTGERAASALSLTEDAAGAVSGTWDGVAMSGARLGGTAVCLEGHTPQRAYHMVVEVRPDGLFASYAADRSTGGRYYGWCALARSGDPARAPGARVGFAGRWSGRYSNTLGQGAIETLTVRETATGDISADWSDGVALTGLRTGPNTFYVTGRRGARLYRIAGVVLGGTLALRYAAYDPLARYYGISALKRGQR